MTNLTANIFGILAVIFILISFQFNSRKKILYTQAAGFLFLALNFFFINAIVGGIISFISVTRIIVFSYRTDSKKADNIILFYSFLILSWIGGIIGWQGYSSLLPLIGASLATIGHWSKETGKIRLFCSFSNVLWIVYGIIVGSWAGIIVEGSMFLSAIIGMIRFDRKK